MTETIRINMGLFEAVIAYDVRPGDPPVFVGPPDNWADGSPDEVSVLEWSTDEGLAFSPVDPDWLFETVCDRREQSGHFYPYGRVNGATVGQLRDSLF